MEEGGRRRSRRIKNQVKKKTYRDDFYDEEDEQRVVKKKKKTCKEMKSIDLLNVSGDGDLGDEVINAADAESEVKIGGSENGLECIWKKNDYDKVRETIKAFYKHYRCFVKVI
ncbi:hypothetical protein MKW98_012817, partial [Papaver atlanticum]